jgi:hypothetical protein
MRPGPCAAKRPGARGATTFAPPPRRATQPAAKATPRKSASRKPPPRRLRRFLVQYRLLGLKRRVQVVSLTFSGLVPGASVTLRCVRRCSAQETLTAGRDGTASTGALIGLWLRRGAVVSVREHRSGWVASSARITVVGVPRGVRIEHGSG